MQCEIILDTFFGGRKRAKVSRRVGISVKTYDCHLQAAFRSLRHLLTQDAAEFTDVLRSLWYDRIEELADRYESARLRRASAKKGERSNPQRDGSNPKGDRGKSDGSAAAEAASPVNS
jgi:hypothetical protein